MRNNGQSFEIENRIAMLNHPFARQLNEALLTLKMIDGGHKIIVLNLILIPWKIRCSLNLNMDNSVIFSCDWLIVTNGAFAEVRVHSLVVPIRDAFELPMSQRIAIKVLKALRILRLLLYQTVVERKKLPAGTATSPTL